MFMVLAAFLRSSFRGQGKPKISLCVVPRNSILSGVHKPEGVLGAGMTLFDGLAVPFERLGIVLRHALTYVDIFPR